jgi:hypothetical protein
MIARTLPAFLFLALSAAGSGALAQPVAALPSPDLPETSRASDYLGAAERSLAAGRDQEAEQALEMAQTRMLDRSVPLGQTHDPSDNPAVGQIARARDALRSGDREACMRLIEAALASASAQQM